MAEYTGEIRDVVALEVPGAGRVEETGDALRPFRLIDGEGAEVAAVTEFLHHMLADDASPALLRSYAYELLAWFRFLRAVGVPLGDRAGRAEARDFALRLKMVKKPAQVAASGRAAAWLGQSGHRQGLAGRDVRGPHPPSRAGGGAKFL